MVKTVEGVKTDALFSYLPPINILAFAILVPLSWVVSARTLHRINVFAIRLTVSFYSSFSFSLFLSPKSHVKLTYDSRYQNFPILIAISAYERYTYRAKQRAIHLGASTMDRGGMDVQRPSLLE